MSKKTSPRRLARRVVRVVVETFCRIGRDLSRDDCVRTSSLCKTPVVQFEATRDATVTVCLLECPVCLERAYKVGRGMSIASCLVEVDFSYCRVDNFEDSTWMSR